MSATNPNAIEAEGLVKRYGSTTALAGVDLTVPAGTVLGVLGPNGAGKTTAVRILGTLLRPDAGRAVVGGYDVVREAGKVREIIGLTGQYASVDEDMSGRRNLVMIGRLLGMNRATARAKADDLLERFELTAAGERIAKTYSGGMRRPASTWPPAWSETRASSTSTSPRPGWTRTPATACGTPSATWCSTVRRCC